MEIYIGDTIMAGPAGGGFLDYLKKNVPAKAPAATDPLLNYVYQEANKIYKMLAPLGNPAASYALYQVYHETNAFSNNGYKKYNNASGIMYAKQHNAKPGPNGYAVFNSLQDWFNAFMHELTKKANPAGANSLEDYNNRLVANKYYTGSPAEYLSGMKRARLVLKEFPAEARAGYNASTNTYQDQQDIDIPGSTDYSAADWKDPRKWPAWAKWAGGITAGLVALKIVTN